MFIVLTIQLYELKWCQIGTGLCILQVYYQLSKHTHTQQDESYTERHVLSPTLGFWATKTCGVFWFTNSCVNSEQELVILVFDTACNKNKAELWKTCIRSAKNGFRVTNRHFLDTFSDVKLIMTKKPCYYYWTNIAPNPTQLQYCSFGERTFSKIYLFTSFPWL